MFFMSEREDLLSEISNRLTNNRSFFMGVAMLSVVLYHCNNAVNGIDLLNFFSWGYIGVDIFFFFSGLGCSFSYNKHSLGRFYKNRFFRIMPLYLIWALVHLTVTCVNNRFVPSFWDVFGISTTLSYWGGG